MIKQFSKEFMASISSLKSSIWHDVYILNYGPIQSKIDKAGHGYLVMDKSLPLHLVRFSVRSNQYIPTYILFLLQI